jgi:hypothetical protein
MSFKPRLLLISILLSTPLQARDILMDDPEPESQYAEPLETWKEGEVLVPSKISLNDLQEFKVSAGEARFRYFIERKSLHTDADKVTRFILLIQSHSGAFNSSYEGFRCGERLYKVYAYGGKKDLLATSGTTWLPIPKDESTDYRAALYDDLICNLSTGKPNSADKVIKAMRSNRHVTAN